MNKIAVVVPTIRPEQYEKFLAAWTPLFQKHNVTLYKVVDGDEPVVVVPGISTPYTVEEIMGECSDLIYNKNDGVRNLGFALAYRQGADIILTLDDDTLPVGDTIQDHLDALNKSYPVSWMNTANEVYMRGFPYEIRAEAECVLSHGVWQGVADFDASTQLVLGTPELTYRKMPVPRGVLFPMCIMNVAFKRKMTQYMYQAPMSGDINRFADIWAGVEAKKAIDFEGWAAVTGYATVLHQRASNPFVNLIKEARGVSMNEEYGEGDYFEMYAKKRARWQDFINRTE